MNKISDFTDADRWVVETALKERYRSQFYYSITEQYGTGRDFDDLAECVTATLRLQADHAKDRIGATSGKTGADLAWRQAPATAGRNHIIV